VKIREFSIDTQDYGTVLIARVLPIGDDIWGELAALRGTEWEKLIPVVSGDALSHALHGHARPLMQAIGPEPRVLLRCVPEPRFCTEYKACITKSPQCYPCPEMPDCYSPRSLPEMDRLIGNYVVRAWKGGRYVVVVEGAEFTL